MPSQPLPNKPTLKPKGHLELEKEREKKERRQVERGARRHRQCSIRPS